MALTNSLRLTEMERQWYQVRVTGATATTPLGELQFGYWKTKVPAAVKTHKDAEVGWLKQMIVANGATPSNTVDTKQLWKEVVVSFGYPVSNFVNQNMKTFFSTNTGTP